MNKRHDDFYTLLFFSILALLWHFLGFWAMIVILLIWVCLDEVLSND